MARRRLNSPKSFERYPSVYAKTSDTWTTRYYNRKQDPIFNMFGLSTNPDDYHKPEGSALFLTNVRYMGEREEDQRAQVMSRKGSEHIASVGEDFFPRDEYEGNAYLNLYEGKAIQWEATHTRRLTGIFLHLYNVDGATGYVKITAREADSKREISNAVIDIESISKDGYSEHYMRFMRSIVDTRLVLRAEILDDVSDDEKQRANREQRSIRILSIVNGSHEYADYSLPNVDSALKEEPYEFKPAALAPLVGVSISDWETMPRSKEFKSGGKRYIIFPVRHDGIVELYKQDILTKEISFITSSVDARAKAVRFAQAEGYLYYVDGYSALRRINLTTMQVELVVPKQAEIEAPGVSPASLTAKAGASLIHFLQNRLYLSGFADDPNLVIVSLIDGTKPRFEQYNDRFYSPDQSPELSAGSPITALADMSDYLIVFRVDGKSIYSAGAGFEAGGASQATPEGANLGVLNQEAVAQGNNNLYFFNPVEGVCRFAGNVDHVVSQDIDNILKAIKDPSDIFLMYHRRRLRMFFSESGEGIDSCLFYYADLQGKLPWYLDRNTPISSAVGLRDSVDIYAIHSEVAAVMKLESQFTDFDSIIELEYDTQYRVGPTSSPNGKTYVRRIHVHEIVNSTHSLYIGLDIDHQDRPTVWRKYIEAEDEPEYNPDAIFPANAADGIRVISIPLFVECHQYQIRLKRYCYKDTAEIVGVAIEYGGKDAI